MREKILSLSLYMKFKLLMNFFWRWTFTVISKLRAICSECTNWNYLLCLTADLKPKHAWELTTGKQAGPRTITTIIKNENPSDLLLGTCKEITFLILPRFNWSLMEGTNSSEKSEYQHNPWHFKYKMEMLFTPQDKRLLSLPEELFWSGRFSELAVSSPWHRDCG